MDQVQIVTDSTADLPAAVTQALGIHVVPHTIQISKEKFRDGIDLDTPRLLKKLRTTRIFPETQAPSIKAFENVYGALTREHDHILSLHLSGKLSHTIQAAEKGAAPFLGRKKIAIIDSLCISRGLGYLVTAAAEAARQGASLDELIKLTRTLIPKVYLVFFVETLDYLNRNGRLAKIQNVLGSMLNTKPLLAIEEGEIVALDKMRTRQRAIEKLCEFTLEFTRVRQITVLHSDNEAEVQDMLEKIREQLPETQVDLAYYGAAVASHVGPDAIGAVIFEQP